MRVLRRLSTADSPKAFTPPGRSVDVSTRLRDDALPVVSGAVGAPTAGLAVVVALGYRDPTATWPLWAAFACLGAMAAHAARAGVRLALLVVPVPFVLAVDPLFGPGPPAAATALVADVTLSTVSFALLAAAEYGLRNHSRLRRELDARTRRAVVVGAAAIPLSYLLARAALGLGWFTDGPLFVVAATVWTLGGLACCGAVAGGALARDVYTPAVVVLGSLLVATVAAADGGAVLVTELTILAVGWFVPLGVAVVAGLVERRLR